METYIRDGDGSLCKVLYRTPSFYHVERVSDKAKIQVLRHSATIEKTVEAFPGDWAISPSLL